MAMSATMSTAAVAPSVGENNDFRHPNSRNKIRKNDRNLQRKARSQSNSRKHTNIVVGRKVVDGHVSVRGADLTINRYIGNFSTNATVDDVKSAIVSQGVDVIELDEISSRPSRFKSFRLRIKRLHLQKIEDADFWLAGVVVRGYFRGKPKVDDDRVSPPTHSKVRDV